MQKKVTNWPTFETQSHQIKSNNYNYNELTLNERWKFWTLTFLYGAVLRWHHKSKPSLAVISSTEISWMANRRMMVQIIPKVILRFPSTISSAPIDTKRTPLEAIKSRALFTLAILWKRILPRSGFGKVSPEITSSNNINFNPLRKSSSMLSMAVPALRRWLLHQAVNVWKLRNFHYFVDSINFNI